MSESDLIATQDDQRTRRAFLSFLTTALGADQAVPGTDGAAWNPPYQYQAIGPTGIAVEGAPRSTAQGASVAGIPPVLLLAGAVALVLLLAKKA